ncbi:beta-phosphoglucomutase [Aestuariibaculum suncheonense]|uniref:Beta-phosphoglucomutase n=1 Tax=Aestuariibaculum suncheonense TaxID=1028745 RepID=A0A8J6QSW6_9FLAO|nr:beta-phosphoglucomutase [Aestuariibaculum suncheonense]MBD0835269.1 beta-phosphoglucomutase [Aestuariibaculum suncheonense]
MNGFIFDLDGVIVDTAKYHYQAWKQLANNIGIEFSLEQNEQLKGVSRVESLKKILHWGQKTISDDEFMVLMTEKNNHYLSFIETMKEDEVLPDVSKILNYLSSRHQKIALGSASKNAVGILNKVNLTKFFDAIVDGNQVTHAKPDPEVFLNAAKQMNVKPEDCIVFEDAVAGIQAANAANMISIGIGDANVLHEADYVFKDFTEMSLTFIDKLINPKK